MQDVLYKPIGRIITPFKEKEGMPIQAIGAEGIKASVEVYAEFKEGLQDLDSFSHIILIYQFHQSNSFKLKVKPFMDDHLRGVFSTRAPKRPNAIGISVVGLLKIEKNILYIDGIDVLDGTPLLDIKPFIPEVDAPNEVQLGWLEGKSAQMRDRKSDKRFNH